jgi:hypothetical protein
MLFFLPRSKFSLQLESSIAKKAAKIQPPDFIIDLNVQHISFQKPKIQFYYFPVGACPRMALKLLPPK